MGLIRCWTRLLLILAWTFPLWGLRLLYWPVAFWDEARDRRWRRWWFRLWARVFARIVGMRVVVHGTPPDAPFYLVSNHLTYMDIFLLVHQTGCGFVARGDMAKWPLIGTMCRSLYILFIDRTDRRDAARVNDEIARTLAQGDGITVFAESRISRGRGVAPFKSALIQPAFAMDIPVHYATIGYRTPPGQPPASRIVGWWRPEPLGLHFRRLLRCPEFTAEITFGPAPVRADDRKLLAERLHQGVVENFTPLQ